MMKLSDTFNHSVTPSQSGELSKTSFTQKPKTTQLKLEDKTVKLIYRAHIYEYTPRPVQPYIKPRAINWRYQSLGERFKSTPRPIRPYVKPRAINWRYQLPELMPSH